MGAKTEYARLGWGKSYSSSGSHSDNDFDADEQLLNEERRKLSHPKKSWTRFAPWMIHVVILLVYIIVFPSLPLLVGQKKQSFVDKTNAYSPINAAISEDYVDLTFDGSLWYDSPYKGPPTPAVNKAWEDLMAYGTISVTAEDITRVGHNLSAVQFPPSVGGGYLAVAMGTHHIHCLHYIWQDHHMAHFPTAAANKAGTPEMYERHYEHCVDYLRQGIMCNFDPGIIPYYWVREHNQPTPDGNTRHKCVNWDLLQDWLQERAVEMPEGFEWHQPPDAMPLDRNP